MSKLDDIIRWVDQRDEEISLGIQLTPSSRSRWSAAMHVGYEAKDSPMVGAASYGMGDTLDQALATLIEEFHIPEIAIGGNLEFPKRDR